MFDLFVRTTKTMRGWPLVYTTYHQEMEAPYRYAAWCTVIRIGRRGLVVGRWTDAWFEEDTATAVAIGARPMEPWWHGWDELEDDDPDPDDGLFGCVVA
jgi:hypothetical protein